MHLKVDPEASSNLHYRIDLFGKANICGINIDQNLNLTLNTAQNREINTAMSNTFGFGGHNACLLFKKTD